MIKTRVQRNSKLFKRVTLAGIMLLNILLRFNLLATIQEVQLVSDCNCTRPYFYKPPTSNSKSIDSTCSDEGTWYEREQRVVSFSMYYDLDDPLLAKRQNMYKESIRENIRRTRLFFPGATLRIYTDLNLDGEYCHLYCNNSDLFWCNSNNMPSLGNMSNLFKMTWRFMTLGDLTVEWFIVRDLDGAILERDAAAVKEWLSTSKALHLMRDSHWHNFPVLGGMWGARNNLLGNDGRIFRNEVIELAKRPENKRKWQDQEVLNITLYQRRAKHVLAHDSYFCKRYRKTEVRPFPVQRIGEMFVGAGCDILKNEKPCIKVRPCPTACRPRNATNWIYC